MTGTDLLKLVEVLGIAIAGGLFVWWQLRDVNQAQAASRRAREAAQAPDTPAGTDRKDPPA